MDQLIENYGKLLFTAVIIVVIMTFVAAVRRLPAASNSRRRIEPQTAAQPVTPPQPRRSGRRDATNFGTRYDVEDLFVTMDYADFDGVVTEGRRIIVHCVFVLFPRRKRLEAYAIEAWCFLRNDIRTFRVDRILKMANTQSGTPIEDPAFWLGARIKRRSRIGESGAAD